MNENTSLTTKVNVGECRLSYCHLFTPAASAAGSEKKYSVSVIIPKTNTKLVNEIKRAINSALQMGMASTFGGKMPQNWRNPLRDGDLEKGDDEAYIGAYFINATSKTKPGIVKRVKINGQNRLVEVTDEQDIYSGCYGIVSINFFPYNNAGNKGIGAGLNNVLKTNEGDYLGGRSSAQTDFGGVNLDAFDNDENDDDLPC
jgi:hypothetical protein